MACFLVPTTEAIVTTIVTKAVKCREPEKKDSGELRLSDKLGWLNKMLWGGSALLAFEHVWHGEVSPVFLFLTAAANPDDAVQMLQEMSTSGVAMALLVTAVWAGMAVVSSVIKKRKTPAANTLKGGTNS